LANLSVDITQGGHSADRDDIRFARYYTCPGVISTIRFALDCKSVREQADL
jgi:hypothetical protein